MDSYILWRSPRTPVVIDGWLEHFSAGQLRVNYGLLRGWHHDPSRIVRRFRVGAVIAHLPQATVMMGVPTFYTRLLAEPDFGPEVCKTIRLFVSGSAPLLPDTFKAFKARTGHVILERYGMTETGMNTSNPLVEERIAGTVGPPLPGVSVRIVPSSKSSTIRTTS